MSLPDKMAYDIQILCDYSNLCGEGPLWDDDRQRLLWVDSDSTEIFEYDDIKKENRIINNDLQTSSLVLDRKGLVLFGHGVWLWNENGEKKRIIDSYNGEILNFNDSIAGPDGCIYAGTYYWDSGRMNKCGKLYRIKADYTIEVLDDGIILSNGMAFSADNRLFYHADSGRKIIYVYDFDIETGSMKNKRIFSEGKEYGIPDGITVDCEDYLWCAMWYEGAVYRYDPDGKVEKKIYFPVKQVSNVAFGGNDMNILFVSSAKSLFKSDLLPLNFDETAKMGGALYYVKTQINGKTENRVDFNI